jgi:hypothetical protein
VADEDPDSAWSLKIAGLAVDALVGAGLIGKVDFDRAVLIAAEEIRVRLTLGDRPGKQE